jgi:hypothetical protein
LFARLPAQAESVHPDVAHGQPSIKDFYPSANGNWDASMLQAMTAMGVFLGVVRK